MISFLIKTYVDCVNNVWKETSAEDDEEKIEKDEDKANEFANAISVVTGEMSKDVSSAENMGQGSNSADEQTDAGGAEAVLKNMGDSKSDKNTASDGQSLSERFSVLDRMPKLEDYSVLDNSSVDSESFGIISHMGDGLMITSKLASAGLNTVR